MSNNSIFSVAIINNKLCINNEVIKAGYFLLISSNKKSVKMLVTRSLTGIMFCMREKCW